MIHLKIHGEKDSIKFRSLIAFMHNEKIIFETQPNDGKPIVSGSLPQREVQKLINGFCELQAAGLWEAFKVENKTMLNELLILISGNDR